jgi:hypothetical protein
MNAIRMSITCMTVILSAVRISALTNLAVILSARGPKRFLHRGPQRQVFVVGVEVGGGKRRICFFFLLAI